MLKKLLSTTGIQLLTTAFLLLFGILIAQKFGASAEMNAYVVSANIIAIVFSVFSNSQSKAIIPYLSKIDDAKESKYALNSIILSSSVLFLFIAIILFFFSTQIVWILAPGLNHYELNLGSSLLKISAIYLFFTNILSLGKAVMEMNLKPELLTGTRLFQVILLIAIFWKLKEKIGIYSLPIAHTSSILLTIPIYIIFFQKKGYLSNYRANLWNNHVKNYLKLISPILIGMLLMRVIRVSDTFLASFLDNSAISHLSYTLRLTSNFDRLFGAFYIIYFPLLAKLTAKENVNHSKVFFEGFEVLFLSSFAIAIFLGYYANDIISIVFERGAFSRTDTKIVANILRAYTIMLITSPLGSYFANTYYGRSHNKQAVKYSVISSVSNIILNFIFVQFWGVYGLAFASSIAYLIGNFLQSFNLKSVNSEIQFSSIIKKSIPIVLISIISLGLLISTFSLITYQYSSTLEALLFLTIKFLTFIIIILSMLILSKHRIGLIILNKINRIKG